MLAKPVTEAEGSCKNICTDLSVCVICQAEASGADVTHCWAAQHPHNLCSAASIV